MSRIGFDISDLHTARADGTTRFTFELAQRFPVMAPDTQWLYFSSGDPVKSLGATEGSAANRNVEMHISPWPRYWTQSRLWLDLYRHKVDVLFMPIQQLPYLRPGRLKTVCVVHDLAWHLYPKHFTYKDWVLQHAFTAYAAREADQIIAVSAATAHDLARFYGREDNVSVVHHGVDHDRFRLPKTEEEKQRGWEALRRWQPGLQPGYILYVGQIQPRKNLVRLVEAFELLMTGWRGGEAQPDRNSEGPHNSGGSGTEVRAERVPAVTGPASINQLVIAGSHGWLNKPIYGRVKQSPIANHILMPGRVPEELLPALYWHADVFVLPSLYEGFGLPIVEAMACGVPVVTSNVGAMPEIAGQAAVLVDPSSVDDIGRGIRKAMEHQTDRRAAGLARAATFTWDRTATQILTILKSV